MTETELHSALAGLNVNKDYQIWDERTFHQAPHKPFLLLSIIDGVTVGWIDTPRVPLSQDLIETFFHYWNGIMGEERNTTIALPYYHMKSEPIWELHYKEGADPYRSSPSLGGLTDRVAYARLDDLLFLKMQDEEGRNDLIRRLLQTYFSEELHEAIGIIHRTNIGAFRYADQLELMAAEPFTLYKEKKASDHTRQKVQQRERGFSITIRKNYRNRCAVCRAKVTTPNGASLIEGAHIVPWNESRNDDPRNGLALCKTHHWMYDRFLLGIEPGYRIRLSSWLTDNSENIQHTLQWDGKDIIVPDNERFMPNREALAERFEHYERN